MHEGVVSDSVSPGSLPPQPTVGLRPTLPERTGPGETGHSRGVTPEVSDTRNTRLERLTTFSVRQESVSRCVRVEPQRVRVVCRPGHRSLERPFTARVGTIVYKKEGNEVKDEFILEKTPKTTSLGYSLIESRENTILERLFLTTMVHTTIDETEGRDQTTAGVYCTPGPLNKNLGILTTR